LKEKEGGRGEEGGGQDVGEIERKEINPTEATFEGQGRERVN